jgi:hypothetical protein
MERTQLLRSPAPPNDTEVLRALVQAAIPTDAPARRFRIGVRNPDGEVYRVVHLYSLAERSRFAALMQALGFEEETGLAGVAREGFHATWGFSKRERVP